MIRIIIVDDHKVIVSGLTSILELDGRMRVVASATDVAKGLALCNELQPDVLILDVRLPDSRGPMEIPEFRRTCPYTKILVLTGFGDIAREQAIQLGADAFLTKELASDVIADTIYRWFPDERQGGFLAALSDREREVARLAAAGLTNKEIGDELFISVNTVKTHLARVLEKVEVRDRTELARRWPGAL